MKEELGEEKEKVTGLPQNTLVCAQLSQPLLAGEEGEQWACLPVNNHSPGVCVLSVRIFTFFVLSVTHSTLQLYFHLFKTFNNIAMEEFWGWIVVFLFGGLFKFYLVLWIYCNILVVLLCKYLHPK